MAGRRNKRRGGGFDEGDEYSVDVPFEDAFPDSDEIPLAKLDEFIVPGSDDKGRKVTVSLNIHPMLDRQIDVILNSRRFPYANRRDLFRHGAARHVAWLLNIRQTVPRHHMSMFDASIEVVRDDEAAMKMEQVFLILHDRVNDHVAKGEDGEARRLISQIDQKLRQLQVSLWVSRFGERFYAKYGSWLRSGGNPHSKKAEIV